MKGDLNGALADVNRSIALDPENAEAYCNLGLTRLSQGNETEANMNFKKCYDLDGKLRSKFEKMANEIKRK